MKVISIIGARPQFVKASTLSRVISKDSNIEEIIVHTGQHFDNNMSQIFFDQMKIPKPDYNLGISSLNHGAMTGRMLEEIEKLIKKISPDWVLVYGDTNSTIAGALAAKKLHTKIGHIEAGLRSFNMKMPEEINRILTDRISDMLFCPTEKSVENLKNEGFENFSCSIIKSGDVMYDSVLYYKKFTRKPNLEIPNNYILSTIHRQENTDKPENLNSIFKAFDKISQEKTIILPLHPRTKNKISDYQIVTDNPNLKIVEPVGYLEMLYLLDNCSIVMTDSGGLQKEAYFFKKPCVTMRNETEWKELVDYGYNIVVGNKFSEIYNSYQSMINANLDFSVNLYGDGHAAEKIIFALKSFKQSNN